MTRLQARAWEKLEQRSARLAHLTAMRAPVSVVRGEVGLVLRALAAATDAECLDLLTDVALRRLEARTALLCDECGDADAEHMEHGQCLCASCWLESAQKGEA